jgi:hypothetical protein
VDHEMIFAQAEAIHHLGQDDTRGPSTRTHVPTKAHSGDLRFIRS